MGNGSCTSGAHDLGIKPAPKEIILSKGFVALVDASDFEWLNQWEWQVTFSKDTFRKTIKYYASRWETIKFKTRASKRRKIYMHRLIMGEPPRKVVDHRDSNGLNNQRHNLKVATYYQNAQNRYGQGNMELTEQAGVEKDIFDEAIEAQESEVKWS